jgi:hypothetical protein
MLSSGLAMKIRLLLLVFVLGFPAILPASGILCSLGIGSSTPISFTTGCDQPISFTNTFDWATLNPQPLSSSSGPTYESGLNPDFGGTPWSATQGPETVTAMISAGGTYPPYLQLDGNTAWVYNPSNPVNLNGYVYASAYNNAVALGFSTIDPAHPTAWYFGETLLTEQNPDNNSPVPISVSFSHPVDGVGFQISTLSDPNFIATLIAYDAQGNVLGTFILNTNGTNVGGTCASLYNSPGAPCTTPAPWIGITDDELHLGANMIARVTILTNMPNFAIGTLEYNYIQTPEPSTFLFSAALLGFGVWRARRKKAGAAPVA